MWTVERGEPESVRRPELALGLESQSHDCGLCSHFTLGDGRPVITLLSPRHIPPHRCPVRASPAAARAAEPEGRVLSISREMCCGACKSLSVLFGFCPVPMRPRCVRNSTAAVSVVGSLHAWSKQCMVEWAPRPHGSRRTSTTLSVVVRRPCLPFRDVLHRRGVELGHLWNHHRRGDGDALAQGVQQPGRGRDGDRTDEEDDDSRVRGQRWR